ncbi:DMT family transporter [Rhodalgimonas zhirmunskyi]|uniref:DMT family transporter n=1 Tax=Rhodalgimonas zhirmunskyi TaxID=2964767 RepID=A0AAJ1X7C8_9RHOB|nr:DMT family transporter [Rhodoalgimonas zhirmunskyi]MDQ2094387.1 DMT family transporter [Rhodoalgimonas zhirmunskyi]
MNPLRGIILKTISVFCFVIMSSLIKATSGHVPPGEAVFFRSFFAIPIILGWLALRGDLKTGLKVASPLGHFWRGFVGTAAMGLMFTSLGMLPLPEVTAIGYAAPILVVIFAAMFLNEQVGIFRLGAVGLGLVGVMIVLSPRLTTFTGPNMESVQALGALVALAGAGCAALAQVYVRKLVQTEQTAAIVFFFSLSSTIFSLFTLPFGWVMPGAYEATLLILAGFIGGLGQICLTSAYRFADASVVAPFDYSSMIFALAIGYLVFTEVPTPQTLLGAGIVILAGVIIILREHRLGLERGRARKNMTPQG